MHPDGSSAKALTALSGNSTRGVAHGCARNNHHGCQPPPRAGHPALQKLQVIHRWILDNAVSQEFLRSFAIIPESAHHARCNPCATDKNLKATCLILDVDNHTTHVNPQFSNAIAHLPSKKRRAPSAIRAVPQTFPRVLSPLLRRPPA